MIIFLKLEVSTLAMSTLHNYEREAPATSVRQEPKASINAAYKICDLAYKNLKV